MQNHCVIIENNDLIQILEGYVIKAYLKKKSKEIEDASYLIFILKTSNISNKDIEKINNYVQIYKDKIYGWINIGFN